MLPLLPITLLMHDESTLARYFPIVAMFSMFPLLERDGLTLQYFALILAYLCLPIDGQNISPMIHSKQRTRPQHQEPHTAEALWTKITTKLVLGGLFVTAAVLHAVRVAVPPPAKYPFIHDALIIWFCCPLLLLTLAYLNVKQIYLSSCNP